MMQEFLLMVSFFLLIIEFFASHFALSILSMIPIAKRGAKASLDNRHLDTEE